MIKNFYSDAILVSNGKKSAKWYKEKLGFQIKSNKGHWITVGPKSSKTVIHLCEMGKKLEPGNTGITFECDDVDKTYDKMVARGVKFKKKPKDDGWGKHAQFVDPDDNMFWLI